VPQVRRVGQTQGGALARAATRWLVVLQYLCARVARRMTTVDPIYVIIICRHCDYSMAWLAGKEYPERCPHQRCKELGDWHPAKPDELTIFDRRLLRSLGIARDEPWLSSKAEKR
jgi:hypothetical protein